MIRNLHTHDFEVLTRCNRSNLEINVQSVAGAVAYKMLDALQCYVHNKRV